MKIKVFHSETQAEVKQLDLSHLIRAEGSCFIGRSQASGLSLDSPNISRLHGKFSRRDGQYYFCDLGSSNGSMIQGEMAVANQDYLLQPGQIIRLGDFVLSLEAVSELPEELPEELPATVIGSVDATVVSTYMDSTVDITVDVTTDIDHNDDADQQVIEAELIKEPSALVKITSVEPDYNLQTQTKALFAAMNQRILAELKAAGNLSRDTYLKAVRRARTSIEQERLIDPEQFEKEAEKHWRSLTRNTSMLGAQIGLATAQGASQLGQRLGAAAKAAWSEFLAHRPDANQPLESTQPASATLPDESPPASLEAESPESNAAQN
ncbi:MAG: FHA domain-containing protein [Cyanobacteria bacterium RM1_2_2]|nr:FHA domain-containing protein [Cyanobacteria bacterium RM1_2_2]